MKIAQVAPLTESVPPKLYGGTERIVSYLTEELVALGHDVTLYASGDSQTRAELRAGCAKALRFDETCRAPLAYEIMMLERLAQDAGSFDVVHFHIDCLHLPVFRRLATPFLTTLHGRLDIPELKPLYAEFSEAALVSISKTQRRPLDWASWAATVHHGIPEGPARRRATATADISPSSAASVPRSGPTSPSASRSRAAGSSASPPRWTRSTAPISSAR